MTSATTQGTHGEKKDNSETNAQELGRSRTDPPVEPPPPTPYDPTAFVSKDPGTDDDEV